MQTRQLTLAALTVATLVACSGAFAQDSRKAAEDAYRDMQATLGVVPGFFRAFPEGGVPGAWASFNLFSSVTPSPRRAVLGSVWVRKPIFARRCSARERTIVGVWSTAARSLE